MKLPTRVPLSSCVGGCARRTTADVGPFLPLSSAPSSRRSAALLVNGLVNGVAAAPYARQACGSSISALMADDDSDGEWRGQRDDGELVGSCCPNCGASSVAFDESAGGEVCTACGELVAGQSFLRPEVGFDNAGLVGVRLHAGDDGAQAARRVLGGAGTGSLHGIFRDRAGASASDAARRRAEQARLTERRAFRALTPPDTNPSAGHVVAFASHGRGRDRRLVAARDGRTVGKRALGRAAGRRLRVRRHPPEQVRPMLLLPNAQPAERFRPRAGLPSRCQRWRLR